jgi:hypothetical protein
MAREKGQSVVKSRTGSAIGVVLIGSIIGLGSTVHGDELPLNAPSTRAEISRLISQLSDPSYAKRTYATRRLCAIGPAAYDAVKSTSASDDPEAALRASRILAIYDRLLFFNAEVTLSFSRSKIGWKDSVDLMVTIASRGSHPVKVPFAIDPADRASRSADAMQVADMLDIGDWIHLQSPQGKSIDLRVDEISLDPEVVRVVQERLNGGPTGRVAPGQRFTLTARDFNRGWARYPLLEAGEYTVTFEYVPDWRDAKLADAGIGRVVSSPATLTVVEAAPATVSRNGIEADCRIAQEGDSVVAYIVNRTDHVAIVNKNFGNSLPFASGDWVFESGVTATEVPVAPDSHKTWKAFRAENLVEVPPGESLAVARIGLKTLRERFADAGVDFADASGSIHFQYNNGCDRLWQSRERASLSGNLNVPKVLRDPLPRRLLSTRQSSNRVHVMDLQ